MAKTRIGLSEEEQKKFAFPTQPSKFPQAQPGSPEELINQFNNPLAPPKIDVTGPVVDTIPTPGREALPGEVQTTTTGGKVETLRKASVEGGALAGEPLASLAFRQQLVRNQQIQQAFQFAQRNPLPSQFLPQGTDYNSALFAAERGALDAGVLGGSAALLRSGGAAVAGGAVAGPAGVVGAIAGIAILGAIRSALSDVREQRADRIAWASAKYDKAEQLRKQLISLANKGGDPFELIQAYQLMEREKRTALEGLEFASRQDPSGFSDKARAKINEIKLEQTPGIRYSREQQFLGALMNPNPDLPEIEATVL